MNEERQIQVGDFLIERSKGLDEVTIIYYVAKKETFVWWGVTIFDNTGDGAKLGTRFSSSCRVWVSSEYWHREFL